MKHIIFPDLTLTMPVIGNPHTYSGNLLSPIPLLSTHYCVLRKIKKNITIINWRVIHFKIENVERVL